MFDCKFGWLLKAVITGIVVGVVASGIVWFFIGNSLIKVLPQPGDDPRVIVTNSEGTTSDSEGTTSTESSGDVSE